MVILQSISLKVMWVIATDKRGYPHIFLVFFSLRNKNISIFRMKKAPYLLLWWVRWDSNLQSLDLQTCPRVHYEAGFQ